MMFQLTQLSKSLETAVALVAKDSLMDDGFVATSGTSLREFT